MGFVIRGEKLYEDDKVIAEIRMFPNRRNLLFKSIDSQNPRAAMLRHHMFRSEKYSATPGKKTAEGFARLDFSHSDWTMPNVTQFSTVPERRFKHEINAVTWIGRYITGKPELKLD